MSEPKFTKGPWKLFNDKGDVVSTKTGDLIVRWDDDHTEEQQLADSILIASSPEMYDFIHFFETFAGQYYCRILGDAGQIIYDEAVRLCKKARGEE